VSPTDRPSLVALLTHARRVPAKERERFAQRLRDQIVKGGLILETCHRVEGYVIATDQLAEPPEWLPDGGRILVGEAAVRHAIGVAVGLDSVALGEDQVLHQLRESVDRARRDGGLDPILERLLALALRAGRRARSWRQGPSRSLADVALAAIEQRSGSIGGREVLVIGAGKIGRLAARAVVASGASVSIANRSLDRAEALANQTGGRVDRLDPGPGIARFAGIVVALGGPWTIGQSTVDALADGSTILVDLSVPAAVDDSVATALNRRFISADALAVDESEPATPQDRSLNRLDALIDATTAEFCGWLEARGGRAAAQVLTERADRDRRAVLDELWRVLPGLEPDTRNAIERMSRHLTGRLLQEPLERLGRDSDGRADRAARELFAL
jgi:glutamyl-tRNA reductase